MVQKIILDTDPGIDDAMAIVFAEASPEIELVGITTVYGNATIDNGTNNALMIKDKFNCQFTVAKGTDRPLKRPPVGPTIAVHGDNGFGDMEVAKSQLPIDALPAYQFIINKLKAEPKQITLVAVGPLTNLALALKAEPRIVEWVKEVVIMGGAFGENDHRGNVTPFAEANIHDDPDAADIVLTANWPVTVIGLDVTEECFFSSKYLDLLREDASCVGNFIWEVSRYYLRFYEKRLGLKGCHVHDPSAIAYVINPDLFTTRKGPIRVITDGPAEGMTLQKISSRKHPNDQWEDMPKQNVAIKVKEKELLDLYRDTIVDYAQTLDS